MRIFITAIAVLCLFLSCSNSEEAEVYVAPQLLSLSFSSQRNAANLIEDVKGVIVGDSIVECWIPHIVNSKLLLVDIQSSGGGIKVGDMTYDNNTQYDFTNPLDITLTRGQIEKHYKVFVYSFTGLPILWINTEKGEEISSKDNYINASFKLQEDIVTRGSGEQLCFEAKIKGRGNSTWLLPKKPYRIKGDKKLSPLGMKEGKSWVLLANYADKSKLRNHLAMYLGSMSSLAYTPQMKAVELMINGR